MRIEREWWAENENETNREKTTESAERKGPAWRFDTHRLELVMRSRQSWQVGHAYYLLVGMPVIDTFVISAATGVNATSHVTMRKSSSRSHAYPRLSAATSLPSRRWSRNHHRRQFDVTLENGSVSAVRQLNTRRCVGRMKLRVQFSAKVNGNPAVLTELNVVALWCWTACMFFCHAKIHWHHWPDGTPCYP